MSDLGRTDRISAYLDRTCLLLAEVTAERDRYRAALERIAFHDELEPADASCNGDCEGSMKRVATEALGD